MLFVLYSTALASLAGMIVSCDRDNGNASATQYVERRWSAQVQNCFSLVSHVLLLSMNILWVKVNFVYILRFARSRQTLLVFNLNIWWMLEFEFNSAILWMKRISRNSQLNRERTANIYNWIIVRCKWVSVIAWEQKKHLKNVRCDSRPHCPCNKIDNRVYHLSAALLTVGTNIWTISISYKWGAMLHLLIYIYTLSKRLILCFLRSYL